MSSGERLLSHLRDHYGIDATAATPLGRRQDRVFRVDRSDGEPWVARVQDRARPRAHVEGDAAILGLLERNAYPAERLATDDAVSDLEGEAILVTRFVAGDELPPGPAKMAMMGDLLGRLHALEVDDDVIRPGGAAGDRPDREGDPRQDRLAALALLDGVDGDVAPSGVRATGSRSQQTPTAPTSN